MGKIDFSGVEVTSVAGIRMSLMLKQEAQKGKHRYDENHLLMENSPVKYSSSFKKWFSTATRRCKLLVQLMEQCMNSDTMAIQALSNDLIPSCQYLLEMDKPIEGNDVTDSFRTTLRMVATVCKHQ